MSWETHTIIYNGDELIGTKEFNFSIVIGDGKQVIIGSKSYLRAEVRALTNAGAAIEEADEIWIREEAPTLFFKNINVKVNGVGLNNEQRADIIRQSFDRQFSSSPSSRAGNDFEEHVIGPDTELNLDSGDAPRANSIGRIMPLDATNFMLIRRLTDLPMFGIGDRPIPPRITVTIEGKTLSNVSSLFKTVDTLNFAPKIFLYRIQLILHVETVTDLVAQEILTELSGDVGYNINTMFWSASTQTTGLFGQPEIDSDGLGVVTSTTPEFICIKFIPNFLTNAGQSSTAYKGKQPLVHVWNNISLFHIKDSSKIIADFSAIDLGTVPSRLNLLKNINSSDMGPKVCAQSFINDFGSGGFILLPQAEKAAGPMVIKFFGRFDFTLPGSPIDSKIFVIIAQKKTVSLRVNKNESTAIIF